MSLAHALLTSLLEQPSSGYDLARRFDKSIGYFWHATHQQIYRELDRLESDGMLDARLVEQTSRPNKRIFTVTDTGEAELQAFIESSSRPTAIRDDLLVKVVALDDGNAEAVAAAVNERLEQATAKLGLYGSLKAVAIGDGDEESFLTSTARIGSYLALLRGIAFEEENIRWCQRVLQVLATRGAALPG